MLSLFTLPSDCAYCVCILPNGPHEFRLADKRNCVRVYVHHSDVSSELSERIETRGTNTLKWYTTPEVGHLNRNLQFD